MPGFGAVSGGVVRTVGVTGGTSSLGANVTCNASANVKGIVTELTSATEFDATWALINLTNGSTGAAYLVDILAGAATETIIIPDLTIATSLGGSAGGAYLFPIRIPKGTRLAAQAQCSSASSQTLDVSVVLISGTMVGESGPSPVVSAYGGVASSLGTNIDPGAVADTDSAWTQITAATTRTHNWLAIGGRFGDGTLGAATRWRVQIGIGAATEAILIPDLHFSGDTNTDHARNGQICIPCFIPAGSRLTAKVRASVTTDGDRDIWLKLYGAG